jgi:hypothetical protein
VDADDMWVVQAGGEISLTVESLPVLVVGRDRFREDLQRLLLRQAGMGDEIPLRNGMRWMLREAVIDHA